uniref:Uncharacterized protein n=1 Tax=Arundo donax TaxID=35708 RepID=A0A0A9DPE3_ARUDO
MDGSPCSESWFRPQSNRIFASLCSIELKIVVDSLLRCATNPVYPSMV